MKRNKTHRPFPEYVSVTRLEAGSDEEFLCANEIRKEAVENTEGQAERRIAVYKLVQVFVPSTDVHFIEVENDDGV